MRALRSTPLLLRVHEVAPRDGLQNERALLPTAAKLALVRRLARSGAASVEVTSFVRPDAVPALADAEELCARMRDAEWASDARRRGVRFAGLVLNERGLDRLSAAGAGDALDTVSLVVSCTEAHSRANANLGVADALSLATRLVRDAKTRGLHVRAYASMAFGCPFEGTTDPARVLEVVQATASAGADVVVLADTLGAATPKQVRSMVGMVTAGGDGAAVRVARLGLHMHDTHGRATANCGEGMLLGVPHVDAAVGGVGGCPFAPGSAGNLATHRLLTKADSLGAAHGMCVDEARGAGQWLRAALSASLRGEPFRRGGS